MQYNLYRLDCQRNITKWQDYYLNSPTALCIIGNTPFFSTRNRHTS